MNLESLRKKIKKEFLASILILLFAIGITILCWNGLFKGDIEASSWFQRSGSIAVLLALWVEYKLFKVSGLSNPRNKDGQSYEDLECADTLYNEFSGYVEVLKISAAIVAILGTLICGYGDILYKCIY